MIPVDLSGKTALITGVADNVGFAWHIAKTLQAAGAEIILASHPRVISIVERFMRGAKYEKSRQLPFAKGELKPLAILPCDVAYDTANDIPEEMREKKGYAGHDVSINGCISQVKDLVNGIDVVIHSVGFSPEIKISHNNVSRTAYLEALSISAYSLIALARATAPLMQGRNGSMLGLSFNAAQRVYPDYGGGMATAKAALESDARNLAWHLGKEGHRVNIISAGPYSSRAAKSIGSIEKMISHAAQRSPIERGITANEVANACLFLCSELASGVTGQCLFVDNGFNTVGTIDLDP